MEKFIKAIRVRTRRLVGFPDVKISIYKTKLFGSDRMVRVDEGNFGPDGDPVLQFGSDEVDSYELAAGNYGISVDDYLLVSYLFNLVDDFEDQQGLIRSEKIFNYNFIPVVSMEYESVTVLDRVYSKLCYDYIKKYIEEGVVYFTTVRDAVIGIGAFPVDTLNDVISDSLTDVVRPFYEIVEDIWSTSYKPPVRSFGKDQYNLNNGSYININWTVDTNPIGGTDYSDNWGREITPEKETRKRIDAVKTFEIIPSRPSDQKLVQGVTFNTAGEFDYLSNMKDLNKERFTYKLDVNSGVDALAFKDESILKKILEKWSKFYPGGEFRSASKLGFSTKADGPSEELQFNDPVEKKVENPIDVTGLSPSYSVLPMTVFLEVDKYFARESLPNIFVQVGDMSTYLEELSGFDTLAEEYREDYYISDFATEEEYVSYYSELAKGQDLIQGVTPYENNNYNGGNAVAVNTTATGKIKKMIEYAYGEIGYTEGKMDGAAGKDTKFGKAFGMNGHHWCGLFVAWCAKQAGIKLDTKGTGFGIPYVIACSTGKTQFSSRGCYTSNSVSPSPGDVAFMNWDGGTSAQHVEIVIQDLGNGRIKCIGGNTSGGKANGYKAKVAINDRPKKYIIGYGKLSKWDPTNADSVA